MIKNYGISHCTTLFHGYFPNKTLLRSNKKQPGRSKTFHFNEFSSSAATSLRVFPGVGSLVSRHQRQPTVSQKGRIPKKRKNPQPIKNQQDGSATAVCVGGGHVLLEIVKVKCVRVIKILFYNFTPSGQRTSSKCCCCCGGREVELVHMCAIKVQRLLAATQFRDRFRDFP